MEGDGRVSVLAGQMLATKARATLARSQGKEAALIEAIERSLRRTLGVIVQIGDPRTLWGEGFSIVERTEGVICVQHRERDLPISSSYLQSLLEEAGVELEAGQVLLPDGDLLIALVEEALEALGQEEAGIRDAKSRLILASLEAGPIAERLPIGVVAGVPAMIEEERRGR